MPPLPNVIGQFSVVFLAILMALFFCFSNGFNDSANQLAAVIVSRALSPKRALILAAIGNFAGAYFLGTSVAKTIGQGIVDPRILVNGAEGTLVIVAALCGAIGWNLVSWYFGLPSSSSHSLIGGLLGAFVAAWGVAPVNWLNVAYIIVIMLFSPFLGFAATYAFAKITFSFSRWLTPAANKLFRRFQFFSLAAQALSHGTNDSQKTMGVIAFVAVIAGLGGASSGGSLAISRWIVWSSAAAMALGTLAGGWRIIKKLGAGLYKIQPIHAFASQAVSSLVLYITAVFGYPISTTQVMSSSIMGAGAAHRFKMVRWHLARDMGVAWLVTIPASGVFAGLVLLALRNFF